MPDSTLAPDKLKMIKNNDRIEHALQMEIIVNRLRQRFSKIGINQPGWTLTKKLAG